MGGTNDSLPTQDAGGLSQVSHGHPRWNAYSQETHMNSGEPDEPKGSRPVLRGVCGKVPVSKDTRQLATFLPDRGQAYYC
jgi:hypothetical protein